MKWTTKDHESKTHFIFLFELGGNYAERQMLKEMLAQLEKPNSWRRETAQRLLYERQDRSALEPLRELVTQSSLPQARLCCRWSVFNRWQASRFLT